MFLGMDHQVRPADSMDLSIEMIHFENGALLVQIIVLTEIKQGVLVPCIFKLFQQRSALPRFSRSFYLPLARGFLIDFLKCCYMLAVGVIIKHDQFYCGLNMIFLGMIY